MSDKNDTGKELKDLSYYIEHPDEMPTDPETISKIMAMDAGPGEAEEEKLDPDKKPTEEKKEPNAEEPKPKPAPASADQVDEPKPDGVLAKDGKHFLPYTEMERRIAAAKEQGAAEGRQAAETAANETVTQLKKQLEQREQQGDGGKKKVVDPLEEIPAELLEEFRKEYPTQAKLIDALTNAIKHRDERNAELVAALQETRESVKKSADEIAAEEVQDLINGVPDLAAWQKDKPVLFNLAIEEEAKLMADPKWVAAHPELVKGDGADAKRYEHVVSLVKQAVGLPAASPKNDNTDLDRKAEEVVTAADKDAQPPKSLSEIKGGSPPAQSLEERLETVSSEDLASNLLAMTPAQREQFFARLG